MRLSLVLLSLLACVRVSMADINVNVPASDKPRRFMLVQHPADGMDPSTPVQVTELWSGRKLPGQIDAENGKTTVSFLIPELPAGKAATYLIAKGSEAAAAQGIKITENPAGYLSITNNGKEFTRYNFGPSYAKYKKPFFYPILVNDISMTRAYPMDKRDGEDTDHIHHTGVWFNHGEVNKKDYWGNKESVTHSKFHKISSGPVFGRIVAQNNWGQDLTEIQDIRIYSAGDNVLMDWSITLRADNGDTHLGKTKEGSFAVRVPTELTSPDPKKTKKDQPKRGDGKMVDAEGNQDENPVRAHAAPWADNYGVINGKTVGVAIMNHPSSWRFPTNWHVRNYGLFAANPFYVQGEHHLKKGDSLTLKYRLLFHPNTPTDAKVHEIYNAYSTQPN